MKSTAGRNEEDQENTG